MFRVLRADEIECRVQSIKPTGLILLLYKDARCDMNILDETVGEMYWKREHSRDNRNCTVSLWNSDIQEWIGKEDTGTESDAEAEKGLASDSFKRACFNWGIGRELYTAPFLWIRQGDYTLNNKGKCYDKFKVTEIGYDDSRRITKLEIVNTELNRVVWRMGAPMPKADDYSKEYASDTERKSFMQWCHKLGQDPTAIMRQAGWVSGRMTVEDHGRACIILKEIEDERQ